MSVMVEPAGDVSSTTISDCQEWEIFKAILTSSIIYESVIVIVLTNTPSDVLELQLPPIASGIGAGVELV